MKFPDFLPTTLKKLNSTMDVFPRRFTNLTKALFSIKPQSEWVYVKDFYNLMSVFALVRLFGTLPKILEKIATFYSY